MKRSRRFTKILTNSFVAFGLSLPALSEADSLSFSEVWEKVSDSSLPNEGARLEVQATQQGLSSSKQHWLPRLYMDVKSYQTNSPGPSLFGLLEQREIKLTDFSPDSLNHPEARHFTRGALGVDLPLYEGGMKRTQVALYEHLLTSKKFEAAQIAIEQYAQSGLAYGSLLSLRKQKEKLKELKGQLTQLMKSYQLGHKSNPVGYSGLLGMKSLANRIDSLIEQLETKEKASYSALSEMGVKNSNWSPQNLDLLTFIDRFFPLTHQPAETSYRSMAGSEAVKASLEASKMEKAAHRPRIGAFAESQVFNGHRDTANAYTAGIYLQWDLYNPASYGSYKEAELKARSHERFHQAQEQQERIERSAFGEAKKNQLSTLNKLTDSDRLLAEQAQVSTTLFKNGSINALQFVEILNRRTDLISQQTDVELSLLKTATALTAKSKFEIPNELFRGEK